MNKRNGFAGILLIIVAAAALIGGVYWRGRVKLNSPLLSKSSPTSEATTSNSEEVPSNAQTVPLDTPAQIISKMFSVLPSVHSLNFSLSAPGLAFYEDSASDLFASTTNFEGSVDYSSGSARTDMKVNKTILEAIIIGKDLYSRSINVSKPISGTNGQWLKINSAANPSLSAKAIVLSQADRMKLVDALQNSGAYVFQNELVDDGAASVPAYHYQFSINKDKLVVLQPQILALNPPEAGGANSSMTALSKELAKNIDYKEAQVWIGKSDLLPYRIMYIVTNKVSGKTAQFIFNLNNFNRISPITPPVGAKSMDEYLKSFLAPTP